MSNRNNTPKETKITFAVIKFLFGVIVNTFGETISASYIGCQSLVPMAFIFGYSILSAEERRASAQLSSAVGTLFWIFVAYTIIFGIFVNVVMPIDNQNNRRVNRRRNNNNYNNNNHNHHYRQKPFCEECGCPDVIVYDDGTCECQGCGFTWRE